MIEVFPNGEFDINKIDKQGVWFMHDSSLICVPHRIVAINSCISCKHFNYKNKSANTCAAFQEKIPDVIFLGKNDHKEHIDNDNGIKYEPR